MVCRACGRIIVNEQANFCEYCGTPVDEARGGMNYAQGSTFRQENYGNRGDAYGAESGRYGNMNGANDYGNAGANPYGGYEKAGEPEAPQGIIGTLLGTAGGPEKEGSMSTLHWIVIMLLPYIPMIGTFAYIVVLLVWAFGKTATKTRRSWARATLIVLVIVFMMVFYMLGGMASDGTLAELMNSLTTP